MHDKLIFKIYIFAYLLLFLQSMHVWFLWGNLFKIVCPILFVIVAYLNHNQNPACYSKYNRSYSAIFLTILIFISFRGSYDAGILSMCKAIIGVIALYELTQLSEETNIKILLILTKCFGIISIVSLVGWIMFLLGVPLPSSPIEDAEFGYSFENYYIFLYNRLGLIPRYCSVFLEPGYYGQLAAIILFANKMRLNNVYNVTILIATLFSLSLAGYVLIIIGFIFANIRRINFKKVAMIVVICFFVFNLVKNYNGGDNAVNDLIIARLEVEDGKLVGDDRSTEELDKYFNHLQNGEFLFGLGSEFQKKDWGRGVAGYKAYIVENGYIGFILAICGYILILYRKHRPNLMMKLCFVLFMALYWQASYPYWFGFFSIYVFSLAYLRNNINTKMIKA